LLPITGRGHRKFMNTLPFDEGMEKLEAEVTGLLISRGFAEPKLSYCMYESTGWSEEKMEIGKSYPADHPIFDSSKVVMTYPDLSARFAEGQVRFVSHGWAGETVYTNPTCTDLIVEAEKCIRDLGEIDHIFLEECVRIRSHKGVQRYSMFFGS